MKFGQCTGGDKSLTFGDVVVCVAEREHKTPGEPGV